MSSLNDLISSDYRHYLGVNDVLIAQNSYVNFDVLDHSIVIGNPARVIHRENATVGYCHNLVDKSVPDEEYSVTSGGKR